MVYSKRVHFELQHDAASDQWFVTGPTFHVNGDARLRAAGATKEKFVTYSAQCKADGYEYRYMFPAGFDGRAVALLCVQLNAELRDTVWRKPNSVAGAKRAGRAAAAAAAASADKDDDEEAEDDE